MRFMTHYITKQCASASLYEKINSCLLGNVFLDQSKLNWPIIILQHDYLLTFIFPIMRIIFFHLHI